ncbi:MAG: hypothetical protein ACOX2L_02810 [Anaerolineae bacterium]
MTMDSSSSPRPQVPAWGWWDHIPLAFVIGVFVVLAARYALVVPPLEMPDEPWHLRRVATVLGRTLPEGHRLWAETEMRSSADAQPPLYYGLAALLTAPINWDAEPSVYELNPYVRVANLYGVTNRNAMFARVPMHWGDPLGQVLAVLRGISVLAAAGSVYWTYRILLVMFRGDRALVWTGLVLAALLPGMVYHGAVSGPTALGHCLGLATAYFSLDAAATGYPSLGRLRLAAVLAVLCALTVWWGWLAVAVVAAAHTQYRRSKPAATSSIRRELALTLGLLVLVAMASPAGLLHSSRLSGAQSMWAPVSEMTIPQRLDLALRSYVGVFGWLNITLDPAIYTALGVVGLLGLSGLLLTLAHWRWQGRSRLLDTGWIGTRLDPVRRIALVWALFSVVIAAEHLLLPRQYYLGSTFLSSSPLWGYLLALGVRSWARTYGRIVSGALAIVALAITVVAPSLYIRPAYLPPQRITLPQVPIDVHALDVSYGDSLYLVGYKLQRGTVEPGGHLPITLYWLARRPMTSDFTVNLTMLGRNDDMLSNLFTRAGSSLLPSSLWVPGDVIVQDAVLAVDADASIPVAGRLGLTVTEDATGTVIEPRSPAGEMLPPVLEFATVRVGSEEPVPLQPGVPLDVSLDGQVTLIGYEVAPAADTLQVTLYWRAEGPLLYDYSVFVHLVDRQGNILEQADGTPMNGEFPTGLWLMGEQVSDTHLLQIPADLPQGWYWLQVGMYRLDTLERLPVQGSDPVTDFVRVGPVRLQP